MGFAPAGPAKCRTVLGGDDGFGRYMDMLESCQCRLARAIWRNDNPNLGRERWICGRLNTWASANRHARLAIRGKTTLNYAQHLSLALYARLADYIAGRMAAMWWSRARWRGLVIVIARTWSAYVERGPNRVNYARVRRGGWHALVTGRWIRGCQAWRNLSLIPGTLGASASAEYWVPIGVELKDSFDSPRCTGPRETGQVLRFGREGMSDLLTVIPLFKTLCKGRYVGFFESVCACKPPGFECRVAPLGGGMARQPDWQRPDARVVSAPGVVDS